MAHQYMFSEATEAPFFFLSFQGLTLEHLKMCITLVSFVGNKVVTSSYCVIYDKAPDFVYCNDVLDVLNIPLL